jgi:hypothetical protein
MPKNQEDGILMAESDLVALHCATVLSISRNEVFRACETKERRPSPLEAD